MAYIDYEMLLSEYPQLALQVQRGTVSSGKVQRWISSAEAIIDSHLSARYNLPLDSVPEIIKTIAYELFEFFWQKDAYTPSSTDKDQPWIHARYDRAISTLREIASGKVPLLDSSGEIIQPSVTRLGAMTSNHINVDQIFTMGDDWEESVDEYYDAEF